VFLSDLVEQTLLLALLPGVVAKLAILELVVV
jgi:hypothetical protein